MNDKNQILTTDSMMLTIDQCSSVDGPLVFALEEDAESTCEYYKDEYSSLKVVQFNSVNIDIGINCRKD